MNSGYTFRQFQDALIAPSDCDRQISVDQGDDTLYMACDYHEGWIDGANAMGTVETGG